MGNCLRDSDADASTALSVHPGFIAACATHKTATPLTHMRCGVRSTGSVSGTSREKRTGESCEGFATAREPESDTKGIRGKPHNEPQGT